MNEAEPTDKYKTQLKPTWIGKHRLLSALLLHGLWKLRWYHTVFFLWPLIIAAAWGASPYFMVYVVGMPEPGTAPRYVGTVRLEGELQRTKSGWIQPKYFIQTSKGEVEFHCGYRSYRSECYMLQNFPKISPGLIYEIGYHRYWGLDYIKYPTVMPLSLQQNATAEIITFGRVSSLQFHNKQAAWLSFLFLTYLYLIWLLHQKNHPIHASYLHAKLYPSEPKTSATDSKEQSKIAQPKLPKSFSD